MIRTHSKTLTLATALVNGVELTGKQIGAIFELKNPRRAIHHLRTSGMSVKSTPVTVGATSKKLRQVVKYSYTA